MRQAQELTELILSVARDRFREVGFEATSLDEVIQRAAISKQTFYSRFDGKADLFEQTLREFVAFVVDERKLLRDELFELPIEEGLYEFALNLLEHALRSDALEIERLVLSTVKQFPHLADAVRTVQTGIYSAAGSLLSAAAARGEIVVDDPQQAALWFLNGTIAPRLKQAALGQAGLGITDADRSEIRAYVVFFIRSLRKH